ncbi:MAG TPA: hypothetical protein VGL27_12230 [Negativicutes bacterium]
MTRDRATAYAPAASKAGIELAGQFLLFDNLHDTLKNEPNWIVLNASFLMLEKREKISARQVS